MKIALIGLGYVGIQLAVGLGRKHRAIDLDFDSAPITLLTVPRQKFCQKGFTGLRSRMQVRAGGVLVDFQAVLQVFATGGETLGYWAL